VKEQRTAVKATANAFVVVFVDVVLLVWLAIEVPE